MLVDRPSLRMLPGFLRNGGRPLAAVPTLPMREEVVGTVPIDKGNEGREHRPDDWERIETEKAARDAARRKEDEEYGPSEEFERAAKPLPENYGTDRPATRTVTSDQLAEMVELWGQDNVDRMRASGRIAVEGTEQAGADQADGRPTDQARDNTNAWDTVEGEKPSRENIHVDATERIHILDGDGQGGGGHVAGTGIPLKSEFPAMWDDEKIVGAIEDVARSPDHPPELQDHETWLIHGTREGVDIRVVVTKDGAIVTGYPESGVGVIRNDKYGNPLANEQ